MVPSIRRLFRWAGVAACAAAGAAAPAYAQPVVDREYAIDLYDGVAIGDTSQIGMGGAGTAFILGSAGALLNPSAPSVRQTTDGDTWSWAYHLDGLTGRYSSDYDNNGTVAEGSGASLGTAGFALRLGDWGGAITWMGQRAPLKGTDDEELYADALRTRLMFSRWFAATDLSVGVGLQWVALELLDTNEDKMFRITAGGLLAGATWVPRNQSYRAGLALETSIIGGEVETSECDPNDCRGYILPREVESSGRLIAGGAYRFGPTWWNQHYPRKFRDEQSLILAADLVITGPTENGHGVEAFGMHQLQRSGRSAVVSIRGGAELEWLPGRLRVRAGSYWEPGRFDGVGGRVHATLGADVRVFEFYLFGLRRGRISWTVDVASRFRNLALSIGFWH